MKRSYIIYILLVIVLLSTGSCVKKILFEKDNGEEEIKDSEIRITIDWENMLNDDVVDVVTIKIADSTIFVEERSQPEIFYLPEGTYDIYLYNTPENIYINETIANIERESDGNIISQIKSLYSDTKNISIQNNDTIEISLKPEKNTRKLILNLDFESEYINSFSGVLSNIASSFDIKTKELNNPDSLSLNFTGFYSESNTLGTIGTNHILFIKGIYGDTLFFKCTKNIGDMLIDFNEDKKSDKILDINIDDNEIEIYD